MRRLTVNHPDKVRRQILAYFASKDEQLQYILRLQAILLLSRDNGLSPAEIADLYGTDPHSVTRWVNRLNESPTADITVLTDKPMGRTASMDKKQLAIIDRVIAQSPRKAGLEVDKWTGKTLSHYLKQQHGIELKTRMCQRWLSRLKAAAAQREAKEVQ
jgi:transposase